MSNAPDDAPILLCYDGSESSARAIAAASELSIRGRALVCHTWAGMSQLVFRGAMGPGPAPLSKAVEEIDELDAQAAERRAMEGAELARTADFDALPLPVKEDGKTWRAIVETAADQRARLIVIGAHGCSGMSRALLGSVSNSVLTHSGSPVLVVPDSTPDPLPDGPILICHDGSEGSVRAIRTAGRLFPGRRAVVLTIWVSLAAGTAAMAGPGGFSSGTEAELESVGAEQAERSAAEGVIVASEAGLAAEPVSSRAVAGPLWRDLLDAAGENGAAAIVMGSRGTTGISAALGSVSHGVVHHSHLPVLVVPPGD
jgi:nucleotide-binding universal stress UspA family protein